MSHNLPAALALAALAILTASVPSLFAQAPPESRAPGEGGITLRALDFRLALGGVPGLTESFDELRSSLEPARRLDAAQRIGAIGPAAWPALGLLSKVFKSDPDEDVQIAALVAILQIDTSKQKMLLDSLDHHDPAFRVKSCVILGRVGPAATAATFRLASLATKDPSDEVRAAARQALQQIRPADAAALLLERL